MQATRFAAVDALRGLAALAVVIHHMPRPELPAFGRWWWLQLPRELGFFGVDGVHRCAQRRARCEVERNRGRRELRHVVDGQCCGPIDDLRHGAHRDLHDAGAAAGNGRAAGQRSVPQDATDERERGKSGECVRAEEDEPCC